MSEIIIADEIDRLRVVYEEIEALIAADASFLQATVPAVSDWSPAQHLYHILGSTAMMMKAATLLAKGAVKGDEPRLTKAGRTVLTTEIIPRGIAQAPDNTRPPEDLSEQTLQESFARSAGKMNTAIHAAKDGAPDDTGLEHPMWGVLTVPEWFRAANVHCRHHLDIIGDIQSKHAA
ncbi:hypothetical protein CRI94_09675 [Longibacter salinarum]|uniref:DinB-like domain-containing protein n=1 Tax=Longibacter salinarum TaxID=1850348 RepID=A0A2A8CY65_9BACT|nr:DinB family protein [Longibacter salinarum]PEN13570.1 hypothetical protein CRI94_09675 [Longibacter salinarum]